MNAKQAKKALEDYKDFQAIKSLIFTLCHLDPKGRVPRGNLQKQIAQTLDLIINPRYYILFQKVISSLGIRKIYIQGKPYYKGLSPN